MLYGENEEMREDICHCGGQGCVDCDGEGYHRRPAWSPDPREPDVDEEAEP